MILSVVVKPNAKSNSITVRENNELHIRIAAPPAEGKANSRLTSYLSEIFNVPKSSVVIIKGFNNTHKTISIIAGDAYLMDILKSLR